MAFLTPLSELSLIDKKRKMYKAVAMIMCCMMMCMMCAPPAIAKK